MRQPAEQRVRSSRPRSPRLKRPFGQAAVVNDLKIAVERHIRRGPDHLAVRARFAARAGLLTAAASTRPSSRSSAGGGTSSAPLRSRAPSAAAARLPLQVLDELRLLLRWLRFKRLHADYATARAALSGDAPALEAADERTP